MWGLPPVDSPIIVYEHSRELLLESALANLGKQQQHDGYLAYATTPHGLMLRNGQTVPMNTKTLLPASIEGL